MKLFFITNDIMRARIAQDAGVDRVMIDLEINGKVERQGHLDTVISRHRSEDIDALRTILDSTELMVRVNPLFEGSKREIDNSIIRGADRLMLPMFTHPEQVRIFLDLVNGHVPVTLLLETPAALARLDEIAALAVQAKGCEIHIGLNDLHLGMKLDFMFELLSGGICDYAAMALCARKVPFGIGGIARIGSGTLKADLILSEMIRLGGSATILSRDFGRIFDEAANTQAARLGFMAAVTEIRDVVANLQLRSVDEFDADRLALHSSVRNIVASLRA